MTRSARWVGALLWALVRTASAETNLVWSDEFDGTSMDTNKWTFDVGGGGWGNNEREFYTSRTNNAFVADGVLHIVASAEVTNSGGTAYRYTSARLKSQNRFHKTRGLIEFRVRLPLGLGFWPATWLLGTNIVSQAWPRCGEIDVMENRGSEPTIIGGTIHYNNSGSPGTDVFQSKSYVLPTPGDSVTNFHVYAVRWNTNSITWLVDGVAVQTWTSWTSSLGAFPAPFDRPFFLLMNLAVGGDYIGTSDTNTINAGTTFPGVMQVDYVRIYDETEPLELVVSVTPTNTLRLDWPTNIVGHLQVQTNATTAGISTNWVDWPGATSPCDWPLAPHGSAYFRVKSP